MKNQISLVSQYQVKQFIYSTYNKLACGNIFVARKLMNFISPHCTGLPRWEGFLL